MLRGAGWFLYPTLLLVLLLAALGRRTHADAPPPPPPLLAPERDVLAETTPIDPAVVVRVRPRRGTDAGTAFSVGDGGVWLTAAASLADCARPAVLVNDNDGVAVRRTNTVADAVAVLTSARGAPALQLATQAPLPGALAYAPGFPRSRPGEVAAHLIGAANQRDHARGAPRRRVLVWAEMGRTEGLRGPLTGLAGAPLLDGSGRVVGLVLAEAPRRGRLYAAPLGELAAAVAAAKVPRAVPASGAALTPDDYGLAADALRRQLRVAPLACIGR